MRPDRSPPLAQPPIRVYLGYALGASFAFAVFATLSSIYRIRDVGLGPFELILVGTVLELTVLLTEVPTGVVADAVSRRLSVLIGATLIGVGFILEGLVPLLATVLLAQVVWGLGAAFESGAFEAWLSDEIGEDRANLAFLRAAQLRQVGLFFGIPTAAWLGGRSLGWPLMAGGAVFLALALVLGLTMRESGFVSSAGDERNPFRVIAGTLRRAAAYARSQPLVVPILGVAVFVGASSETFDRLWEARLLSGPGLPDGIGAPVFFAVLAAVTAAAGIAVAGAAHRSLKDRGGVPPSRRALVRWLTAGLIVQAGAVAGFGLAGRLDLALGTYLVARVAGRLHAPLYRAWLNRELEPATRATVFSAAGMADAAGQVLGGPLLGLVATLAGMPTAFVVTALLLGPAVALSVRALGWERRRAA